MIRIIYIILCLVKLPEASFKHFPRVTLREGVFRRVTLPGDHTHIQLLHDGQQDIITAAGQRQLYVVNFKSLHLNQMTPAFQGDECTRSNPASSACHYNITVFQKRKEANQLFLCGTSSKETTCCNMNTLDPSSLCTPSKPMAGIKASIKAFVIKEQSPFALIESSEDEELYLTHSGTKDCIGIFKFGRNRVGPGYHEKEQLYVGLVPSRDSKKLYAFYKEKTRALDLEADMWMSYVAQICMADKGGPKSSLQFEWTSQLTARLFCGDHNSRQHYSELVDIAAIHGDQWQDTRVYALFRNQWGMSAVCVYTVQHIEDTFTTSKFKGHSRDIPQPRPGMCVPDSRKLPLTVLKMVKEKPEMQDRVLPLENSGPLFVSHHGYTLIRVDNLQHNSRHSVLFLSLEGGGVHKVLETELQAFVIAEYRPFNHKTHILNMIVHPSTKKLYVSSSKEIVQVDVGSCAHYGDTCEQCILARDPYCGWNGFHCGPTTNASIQDVEKGIPDKCKTIGQEHLANKVKGGAEFARGITLPLRSRYYLSCPVSSHHATYSWRHHDQLTNCDPMGQECLILIDSMGPKEKGTYICESQEMSYKRELARYKLQLANWAAGRPSIPLAWVCLTTVVIMGLYS
ncbi:semaphorin-7A-like [Lampris incognitus]|uniref:semaphorin-7A-like n=1 Tax=Lampris incognitus TaxID=2546036 RepID=UPI0024B5D45E|nr:semaphorin-7A-like [Lampris incognitus]